jgi:hypothetical protein
VTIRGKSPSGQARRAPIEQGGRVPCTGVAGMLDLRPTGLETGFSYVSAELRDFGLQSYLRTIRDNLIEKSDFFARKIAMAFALHKLHVCRTDNPSTGAGPCG